MEQVKLITGHTIRGLEIKINEFMATLDEHTDIIDVRIDSEYKDHLLTTIRYTVYKHEHKDPTQALMDSLK